MNKQADNVESNIKQQYAPPTLRVIELVTDEVLGVGCKTASDMNTTGICGTSSCGWEIGS